MKRSTMDLIDELLVTAQEEGSGYVALVVGFETRTEFVFAHVDGALDRLNGFIDLGGEPVGLMAVSVEKGGGEGKLKLRPLAEYEEEEWVEKYLWATASEFKRMAASVGGSDKRN